MSSSLATRLQKLEASAQMRVKKTPKVVRLVVNEDEEQEAYRRAAEMSLDTSPDSSDILVIRLVQGGLRERENG